MPVFFIDDFDAILDFISIGEIASDGQVIGAR